MELTWEPDDKDSVYFLPEDYANSVKLVREELRSRGISDERNEIVGPGTSTPTAAKSYIEALGEKSNFCKLLLIERYLMKDEGALQQSGCSEKETFADKIIKTH